jgi:hypothetical protein
MKASSNGMSIFVLVLFLLSQSTKAQPSTDTIPSFPVTFSGWSVNTERIFNDSTLYNYIDGAAELYLSFGFSKVVNRIYSRANQPDILVDIFYMNTCNDAYGVFTHTVGKTKKEFGFQSQHTQGAIVFWKANYYVSIFANPETEESKTAMIDLAKTIDASIHGNSLLPDILNYLPGQSIDPESIRYFRHYIWLNSYYNISRENILNINQKTHAVLAKYGDGEQKTVLLIIKYPTDKEAYLAHQKFVVEFDKELKNKTLLINKKKWMGAELINQFFVGVFNSENKKSAKTLLALARKEIENKQIKN